VWRPRTLLAVGLAVLAVVLFVGFLGSSQAGSGSASSSTCPVHYHPWNLTVAACSVPHGATIDVCALLTGGYTSCPIVEPDLNPADWLGWLSCSIVNELGIIEGAIVGFIESYVLALLTTILNDLISAVLTPFDYVLNALASAVVSVIQGFGDVLLGFFNAVNQLARPLGPFAPILTVTLTLSIFLAAGIGLYFVVILLIAFGKTLFNLL
jgi:hypothetical protein